MTPRIRGLEKILDGWSAPLTGVALTAGMLTTPLFAVVSIDFALVGNAGNAADTVSLNPGYGGVAYAYEISKNETTIT